MSIASVLKRHKQSLKHRLRNRIVKSEIKTYTKTYINSIKENKDSGEIYIKLSSMIDKAVQKGIFHKNTAARKKSSLYRLMKK